MLQRLFAAAYLNRYAVGRSVRSIECLLTGIRDSISESFQLKRSWEIMQWGDRPTALPKTSQLQTSL